MSYQQYCTDHQTDGPAAEDVGDKVNLECDAGQPDEHSPQR
jgi:hypothetical protein